LNVSCSLILWNLDLAGLVPGLMFLFLKNPKSCAPFPIFADI
jgi:hypothetical protein